MFYFYKDYTYDSSTFVNGSSRVWTYDKALTMVVLIFIMILERIANRTDTKEVEKKSIVETGKEDQSFFSNEDVFKKSSTQRSMTISLKTLKTGDIDM
jgi:hypothetical protein